jgi:hypothetical protein
MVSTDAVLFIASKYSRILMAVVNFIIFCSPQFLGRFLK